MSSFPPKQWEVRYLKDFDDFHPTTQAKQKLYMAALMAMRPAEGREGHFRIAYTGSEPVVFQIKPTWVVNLKELEGMELYREFRPGSQIVMQPNSMGKIA